MAGLSSKDPAATLDFVVDWEEWLAAGDTIESSSWTVPAGLTKIANNHTATTTRAWFSGGTAGVIYEVVGRVTSVASLIDERTFHIVVENQ